MRLRWMAIGLASLAVLGTACTGDQGGGPGATTDAVTMVDNEFQPADFTAASDSVTLTNDGQTLHNFTLSAAQLDEDLQPGDAAEVDLSALGPGSYEFLCSYHPEMTGSVTIE
jgi:plastocyanin